MDLSKIIDFYKNNKETIDKVGKTAATLGAGAIERNRAINQATAGIDYEREMAKKQGRQSRKAYSKILEDIRNRPDLTQADADSIQGQKELAEGLLASGDARAQEQRSDIVSQLQGGDPRAAAGLLNTLDKLDSADLDTRLRAAQMKAGADAQTAALTRAGADRKQALDQLLFDRAAMGADESRRALIDLKTREEGAKPAGTASGMQAGTALATLLKDFNFGNPGAKTNQDTDDEVPTEEYGGRIKAEAGMRYMADQGFKTKGEFSHKRNKKAVIDEEDGKKEAELTGGEIVFNPDQTSEMEALIAKGNSEELMEYMKDLLSKPQFQD